MMYTESDGISAVKAARNIIEIYLKKGRSVRPDLPEKFSLKGGVFVTLHTYPARELRGCIGFPEPVFALKKALSEAAVAAATQDPRFPTVEPDEMTHIIVEVSLLTPPETIRIKDPEKLPGAVSVGRDGLIASLGPYRGLLLPQVPVEQGWDVETFLSHTCLKAGIPARMWREGKVEFESFRANVFSEMSPRGSIEEKM